MSSIKISYKKFKKHISSIIFNYDYSKLFTEKVSYSKYGVDDFTQLGYFKEKEYDKLIIEATNSDIKYFFSEIYQELDPNPYLREYKPYIKLKKYNSTLNKILENFIKPKIKDYNDIKQYYGSYINTDINCIDYYKLFNCKMPQDIPIIYYKSKKSKGIKLINIYSDLLNKLVNNNKVKIQLELMCNIKIDNKLDDFEEILIELNMNVIKIKIYKNPNYDDSIIQSIPVKHNKIDLNKSIFNFDKILKDIRENIYDFQEDIINILNYFKIEYDSAEDPNYTLTRHYVVGEDTYFTNMTIIFDDRFSQFDITETIKQEFSNIDNDEYSLNDIFFIEIKRNKEYVIVYSDDYRYGYGGCENYEIYKLYSNILKMLFKICDINKYSIKLNKKSIKEQNDYNIINRTLDDYVYGDYSDIDSELFDKVLETVILSKYDDFDYDYVNACIEFDNGIKCFQNKSLKEEFDEKLYDKELDIITGDKS